MGKIDLEKLQKSLTDEDIISLLTNLGADRYNNKEDYIIFPTICHNINSEDASMKLYYYKNTKLFYCYTECDESFNIFSLFEKVYSLQNRDFQFSDILKEIIDKTKINSEILSFEEERYKSIKEKYRKKNRVKKLERYDEGVLKVFEKHYPVEWLAEGISRKSMDKYNILYSISRNKIIIPHYNINNQLIGIRGRSLNPQEIEKFGKYMPVEIEGKMYTFPLSQNLYGLNISKNFIKNKKKVIIFEGEKSTYKYDNFFSENISCACCGSSLNKSQLDILLKNFELEEIILAFDKEYINYNSEKGRIYFYKLENLCKKYSNYCNFSFIYDKEGLLKEKDSPVDRGKNIFLELYKKRIIVRS